MHNWARLNVHKENWFVVPHLHFHTLQIMFRPLQQINFKIEWLWVPKRQKNFFLRKDRFEEFADLSISNTFRSRLQNLLNHDHAETKVKQSGLRCLFTRVIRINCGVRSVTSSVTRKKSPNIYKVAQIWFH